MRHRPILAVSSLILVIASILAAAQRKDERLHPYMYLIPKGYVGWIRVDFAVRDAPPLPVKGNYYVVKIPATGHFQTSTLDAYRPTGDVYLYECGVERQKLIISQREEASCRIWGNFEGPATISDATPYPFRYFFVGPKEQYEKYQFSGENLQNLELEKDGFPKVGTKVIADCNK